MPKTIFFVLVFSCVLVSCQSTGPSRPSDGTEHFNAGNESIGAGQTGIDKALSTGKNLAGEIDATGDREEERTGELTGEVVAVGEGATRIDGIIRECEDLLQLCMDELSGRN